MAVEESLFVETGAVEVMTVVVPGEVELSDVEVGSVELEEDDEEDDDDDEVVSEDVVEGLVVVCSDEVVSLEEELGLLVLVSEDVDGVDSVGESVGDDVDCSVDVGCDVVPVSDEVDADGEGCCCPEVGATVAAAVNIMLAWTTITVFFCL